MVSLGLFLTAPDQAQGQDQDPAQATLSLNSKGAPQVTFTLQDGWKIYGPTPQDSGFPPDFDWSAAQNVHSISEDFPAPTTFPGDGKSILGYEKQVVVPLTVTPKAPNAPLVLRGEISYLACHDSCRPLTQSLGPVTLEPKTGPSLWMILALALVGGLILNIMPCVLPVLGLKLHGLMRKAHKDTHRIRKSTLTTVFGILSFFAALALVLNLLLFLGHQVGWGIQFQSPYFLGFMMAVTLVFTLNLFGVFEFRTPDLAVETVGGKSTGVHDFSLGFFAALLATPCTAPFLGTAVAYGLANGPGRNFLVFMTLGVGFAFPYLLIALRPQWIQVLPKPGNWMITVKKVLGVMMAATTVWLGSLLIPHLRTQAQDDTITAGWVSFDEGAIPTYVAQGKWVFVDITADWCVTCKANKAIILESGAAQALLDQPHIIKMRANWTKRSTDIAQYLKSQGRAGIPFNAVYKPGLNKPILLPEILTLDVMKDTLTKK